MTATRTLALAAAQRVVDRVHRHTSHGRTLALPAVAAGLAELDQLVLGVADLADRCLAGRLTSGSARGQACVVLPSLAT
jgi:hypothetical protein